MFSNHFKPRFIFYQDKCVGCQVEILARTVRTGLQCYIIPLGGGVHSVRGGVGVASSRVQGDGQPSPALSIELMVHFS